MLRKLSRKLSRKQSDEFVSVDAARLEREEAQRRKDKSKPKAILPQRRSWKQGDEQDFVAHRSVEALMLEPIIAPTLRRMVPTVAPREALTPRPTRRPDMQIEMPPRVFLPPCAEPGDLVLLSTPIPGLTVTPAEPRANPFDQLPAARAAPQPAPSATAEVAQVPRRPPLRRKAVSYRTQRDLPLRVQAVRRAHQEQFARRLADAGPLMAPVRRKSDVAVSGLPARAPGPSRYPEVAPLRPPQPLLPEHSVRRARSEAHLGQSPKRSPSSSGAPVSPQQERDFYIEAAEALWRLPSPEERPNDIPY